MVANPTSRSYFQCGKKKMLTSTFFHEKKNVPKSHRPRPAMVFLGRHTQGPCTLIKRAAAVSIEVLQVVLTETRILISVPFYFWWVSLYFWWVRCKPDAGASVDRRKRLGAFLLSEIFWPVAHHGMYEPNDAALYVALGHSS